MRKRKFFLITFLIFTLLYVCMGLIKINIINTKALSPLGTAIDNYEIVSKEFGEDFSNFIKDRSLVKIYNEESEETIVKIGDEDFIIKDESKLVKGAKYIISKIGNSVDEIKDRIDKK